MNLKVVIQGGGLWYEFMRESVSGFTIVELLIVIVVIAILAAISIAAYTGIQNRAYDSAVKSDLRSIGQKVMIFQATEGRLPLSVADLASLGMKASKGAYGHHYTPASSYDMAWCPNISNDTFAVIAASKSGNVWVPKDGSVNQGVGPLVTLLTTYSNNGQSSPSNRTWFFNNANWRSFIGD